MAVATLAANNSVDRSVLATLCACVAFSAPEITPAQLASWGEETLDLIDRRYGVPGGPFPAEAVVAGDPKREVAFNWSAGVYLSALNSAARWDDKYKDNLRSFADQSRHYFNMSPPVPGYDVLPFATTVDRFYDDNAWMAMALVDTGEILGDAKYLSWAKDALRFALSGEDAKLDGGIYWRENPKTSKNTCSNAPVAAACLSIWSKTGDSALLAKAEELYAWTKRTLQDPDDHLMWDNVSVSDEHIDKTKWSYNTALMLRSAVKLYEATKRPEYLHDARELRVASLRHWLRQTDFALKDDGPFAHLLVESWIAAEQIEPTSHAARIAALAGPLRYIHDNCRLDGYYGKRWDTPPAPDARRFQLIDQASAARAYFEVALLLKA